MDAQALTDWVDFCEGRKEFDRYHFASLFMEFCAEPLTGEDKRNLRTIFQYVPSSSQTLTRLLKWDQRAEDKSDDEIIELIRRDLHAKKRIVEYEDVIRAIDMNGIVITADEEEFQVASNSDLQGKLHHSLASFFVRHLAECDRKASMLSNAFYGLANDLQLQWALTADLLRLEIDFSNYIELYLIGVDYVLGSNRIVAINYRACPSESTS